MDTRSRKLLSRLGAAMLLGLSLFNLAAAFGKTKGEELPKRARQIRKREKEEVKPEVQMVADIAEQEAKEVIAQQETQSQVQSQTQQLSVFQQTLRAVAVVVWSISAVVFFGSMVFNQPFALGKAALSLLPGVPHVASLQLDAVDQKPLPGSQMQLNLYLDSNGEVVNSVRAVIQFDTNVSRFETFVVNKPDEIIARMSQPQSDQLELVFSIPQARIFKKESIVTMNFIPNEAAVTTYRLDFDRSIVLSNKKDTAQNILGKVTDAEVRLPQTASNAAYCTSLGSTGSALQEVDTWRNFSQGTMLPGQKRNWTNVSDKVGFRCGHDSTKGYLIVAMQRGDFSQITVKHNNQAQPYRAETVSMKWDTETQSFWVIPFEKGDQTKSNQFSLKLMNISGQEFQWPDHGSGQIVFE